MKNLVATDSHEPPTRDQRAIWGLFFILTLAAWQYSHSEPESFDKSSRRPMYLQLKTTDNLCLAAKPGNLDIEALPPALAPFSFAPLAINHAEQSLLQTVPGIGPGLAERIVQWRQVHGDLRGVEDLQDIPGIGKKRAAAWASHFSFAANK